MFWAIAYQNPCTYLSIRGSFEAIPGTFATIFRAYSLLSASIRIIQQALCRYIIPIRWLEVEKSGGCRKKWPSLFGAKESSPGLRCYRVTGYGVTNNYAASATHRPPLKGYRVHTSLLLIPESLRYP